MIIEDVIEALKKHGSKRATLVELGFAYTNSTALKKLSKIIQENKLEHLLNFKNNRRKGTDWSSSTLKELVAASTTYSEVLRKMKLSVRGRNISLLKNKLIEYDISTNHFNRYSTHYLTLDEVFIISREVSQYIVKKKYLKLVPYKCSIEDCGISEWKGKAIGLELDHINGVNYDHRIENLRLLCPNCHTQTSTHCRGNKGH